MNFLWRSVARGLGVYFLGGIGVLGFFALCPAHAETPYDFMLSGSFGPVPLYLAHKSDLKLSDDQVSQMTFLMSEAHTKLFRDAKELHRVNADFLSQLSQVDINLSQTDYDISQRAELHSDMEKTLAEYLAQIGSLLTPEQKTLAKKLRDGETEEDSP